MFLYIRFLKIFQFSGMLYRVDWSIIMDASKGKKVKVTLVQALRLCTGRTAHRGSRGIAILFHDHGTRRGWGVSVTPRPHCTPGKDPVPIVQEAGWTPGPVWTGAENLALTGIPSPDRPARSQSLYRLRYPTHTHTHTQVCIYFFFNLARWWFHI
jgi:hypothetical protein